MKSTWGLQAGFQESLRRRRTGSARVKTERYNLFVLERELRDVVHRLDRLEAGATAAGPAERLRAEVVRAPGGARAARVPRADSRVRARRGAPGRPRACGSAGVASRGRDGARRRAGAPTWRPLRRRRHLADYPGLIDYHEQHRYAYELLGLDDQRELELGAAACGTSRAALAAYADGIVAVLGSVRTALRPGASVVIVVNDRRSLYPEILDRAGLRLDERLRRHVNRRTRAPGR